MNVQTAPPIIHSTCPHDCPSTCALEVEKLSETQIGRVRGARDNNYTLGVVCAKVARYAERVHHPDRLREPLRRVGPKGVGIEAFEPMSWDDALDEVAGNFRRIAKEYGSEAIWPYHFAGTMGLVSRDGLDRFRHAFGTSRMKTTICTTLPDAGWIAGYGMKRGGDARGIAESDLVVVWGGNPVSTQVNLMSHISRARKDRDAELVVIDVYRTPTAETADRVLLVRPGTDGALAAAVMHVMFRDGYADRDFLASHTDAPEDLEEHLRASTPEWAAGITGLSIEEIESFAALYGRTDRAFIRAGYGFARSRNGAASMHAVGCLPVVGGKWKHRGGGALYANSGMYPVDFTLIKGLDVLDPSARNLDMCRLGAILLGEDESVQGGPPVMGMIVQNTNPMMVCPDLNKVAEGFRRDDLFLCVHEQFMTETAAMADIVLPATMFLEHDDMYFGSAHTHLSVARPVIEPLAECRPNHEVLCGLAERLGIDHRGFRMSAWEIIDETLKASGLPDAESVYADRWIDCGLGEDKMHFRDGFAHDDEKFHFRADWSKIGPEWKDLPPMPGFCDVIDAESAEHPYRMVTAPARQFLNSSFTETPTSRERERGPRAKLHPDDCTALGVQGGDMIRLGNRQGSIKIEVEPFDGIQRGVVVVESIWPNSAFEEGVGINALVSSDPGLPAGGAVFHDTAIWIRPV